MSNTTNALEDFDICVALAQQAINSQMSYAWKAWKRRTKFDDTIRIFKRKSGGEMVNSKQGLEATFAPLKVSLAVEDGRQGQVRVTLPLTKGKVTFYNEETEALDHHEFTNWSISFITDLDKKHIDLNALEALDPDSHATAKNLIKDSALPEAVFSIEYLFLQLTSVDLLVSDNKNIAIPANVPDEARTRTLQMLNYLLQGDIDYMLSTFVRRNTRQATPTFALTDFAFNVRPNWDAAQASSLEYLGALGGRPMPPDLNAARLKLNDNWFGPDQIDGRTASVSGVMVLSREILLDKYLMPAFATKLGVHPTRDGNTWHFESETVNRLPDGNVFGGRQELSLTDGYKIAMHIVPGESRIELTGSATGKVIYDGFSPLDLQNHIEWLYVHGGRKLTGDITLAASGTGADFVLEPSVTHQFADYAETKHEKSLLMSVYAEISEIANFSVVKSIDEVISLVTQLQTETITSALDAVFDDVTIALKHQGYIPPGGGIFSFQKPRFTKAGDLMMDVIYIAP